MQFGMDDEWCGESMGSEVRQKLREPLVALHLTDTVPKCGGVWLVPFKLAQSRAAAVALKFLFWRVREGTWTKYK